MRASVRVPRPPDNDAPPRPSGDPDHVSSAAKFPRRVEKPIFGGQFRLKAAQGDPK